MKLLLDTDTCIQLLRGRAAEVEQARRCSPRDLAISVVTAYELLSGAERCLAEGSPREEAKVRFLLEQLTPIPWTIEAARKAATLRVQLEAGGRPIGPMDLFIAASALQLQLPLVTGNLREFQRVPGLTCVSWSSAP